MFVRILFVKAEKYTRNMGQVGKASITTCPNLSPSQSAHMPCSNHEESAVLILYKMYVDFFLIHMSPTEEVVREKNKRKKKLLQDWLRKLYVQIKNRI
jgi:penicillin-binding protein-related factor A (putative recombinase)